MSTFSVMASPPSPRLPDFRAVVSPRLPRRGIAAMLLGCLCLALADSSLAGPADESSGLAKHLKWRASLPRCAQGDTGLRENWPDSGRIEKLRGVLALGDWSCTLMGCDGSCCNDCSFKFTFVPRAEFLRFGKEGDGKPIELAGKPAPLGFSAMDCEADSITKLPPLEVLVSGHLKYYGIAEAALCVVGDLPLPAGRKAGKE